MRATATPPATITREADALTFERHYTVEQIAKIWSFSEDTVRRMFKNEPGVLKYGDQKRGKRPYKTLSIPEAVVERVHKRLRVVG
jgi:hypothetical protein